MLLRDEFLCLVLCGVYSNLTLLTELCKVNVILRLFQKLLAINSLEKRE